MPAKRPLGGRFRHRGYGGWKSRAIEADRSLFGGDRRRKMGAMVGAIEADRSRSKGDGRHLCRKKAEREASPTAAIIDSQSVKSAKKGGPASIRMATMRARRSRARSAIYW